MTENQQPAIDPQKVDDLAAFLSWSRHSQSAQLRKGTPSRAVLRSDWRALEAKYPKVAEEWRDRARVFFEQEAG